MTTVTEIKNRGMDARELNLLIQCQYNNFLNDKPLTVSTYEIAQEIEYSYSKCRITTQDYQDLLNLVTHKLPSYREPVDFTTTSPKNVTQSNTKRIKVGDC